jgi:serine protease
VDCVGKIAVVSRGQFTFAEKTRAAQDAGCIGIVIHNNQPGNFAGTLGTATDTARGGRAWIPGVSISLEEGAYLDNEIRSRPTTLTLINTVGNMATLSGTSMASPHAAGVAALVLSRNPALTPDQVRQVLRASAEDLGSLGWDPVFGYGRVNAKRAVQQTP